MWFERVMNLIVLIEPLNWLIYVGGDLWDVEVKKEFGRVCVSLVVVYTLNRGCIHCFNCCNHCFKCVDELEWCVEVKGHDVLCWSQGAWLWSCYHIDKHGVEYDHRMERYDHRGLWRVNLKVQRVCVWCVYTCATYSSLNMTCKIQRWSLPYLCKWY